MALRTRTLAAVAAVLLALVAAASAARPLPPHNAAELQDPSLGHDAAAHAALLPEHRVLRMVPTSALTQLVS
jgi:hypothetical protein